MLIEVNTTIQEQNDNFNKVIENIEKYQTNRTENTIPELKNLLEGFSIMLDQVEKRISDLKTEQQNSSNYISKKRKE